MVVIAKTQDFKDGQAKKFEIKKGKETLEGFVLRRGGKFFAYVNRCKHISIPLDYGDEDFLTSDNKFIMCKNHGALYEPETGLCVSGPCAGRSLEKIELEIKGGKVYFTR